MICPLCLDFYLKQSAIFSILENKRCFYLASDYVYNMGK